MIGGIQLTTTSINHDIGMLQVERYIPELVDGFVMMMWLYAFALFMGLGLGIVLAIARHYGGPVISRISTAYIEFLRGTPLVAQVLAVTFIPYALNIWLESQGLPPLDFSWRLTFPDIFGVTRIYLDTRILLAALTLGLNSGAYQAEFFRGALSSLSAGQTLAAQSIGMTKRQEIRHIALPQSLRRAIPAWSNEAVYLPKYVTVVYFVGVRELFGAAKLIVSRTYQALFVFGLIAIIFLILITTISWILDTLYKRVKIPGV